MILVTGANGFVGRALHARLRREGKPTRAVSRGRAEGCVPVGAIDTNTDWSGLLSGVEAVVHLAARVHVMRETSDDPLRAFRITNVEVTESLARQAARAGVKRFVFVSTIKVNGEGRDEAYRETDVPAPEDAYAISKWEAEQGLWRIARETGLEVVVLRPPLVYGPGVKANFRRLLDIVARGWPLPLGGIRNHRSLLYLGNFIDAILTCLTHPEAAGQTFLLDDGQPVSTPELVRAVARAMNRPACLIAVPPSVLAFAGTLAGRRMVVARLTGSLWVDSSLIRTRLGWAPPYSLEAGLAETVAGR